MNLFRGARLGLPSGETVSWAIGHKPISSEELTVGSSSKPLLEVSEGFQQNAPLWYYILEEARQTGGERLGPVGSRIVMETVVALMMEDGHSFLRQNPLWKPDKGYDFDMADFIRIATDK